MGIDLMKNFERPYFSKSISEFWKRWHISLSSWFRDYLYIPLGGNRVPIAIWFFNLMITFLVSGLWHGADWTFVIWGGLHGLYLVTPLFLTSVLGLKFKLNEKSLFVRIVRVVGVFILVDIAWVFFRAESLNDAVLIIKKLFFSSYEFPSLSNMKLHLFGNLEFILAILTIGILVIFEYLVRGKGLDYFYSNLPEAVRMSVYFSFLLFIVFFGYYSYQFEFIYFQF
jgi:D-alanyl-lipoteichoic acid acyltransferase DltB (MBOAT superfamily)